MLNSDSLLAFINGLIQIQYEKKFIFPRIIQLSVKSYFRFYSIKMTRKLIKSGQVPGSFRRQLQADALTDMFNPLNDAG